MNTRAYRCGAMVLSLLAFGLVCIAVMSFVSIDQLTSLGSDNASYLLMAEWFSPYQTTPEIISEAASRQTYPPLFPLVLALLGASSDYLWAHRIVGVSFLLACIFLYLLAKKMLQSEALSIVVVVGFVIMPASWVNLLGILSENQYLAISLAVCLLFRYSSQRWRHFGFLSVMVTALVLTRSVGLSMVVALLIATWLGPARFPKSRFRWVLVCVTPVIVTIIWSQFLATSSEAHYLTLWSNLVRDISESGIREVLNLLAFQGTRIFEAMVTAFIHHWTTESEVTFFLLLLVLAIGLIDLLARLRRKELEAIYFLTFLGVLLLWRAEGQMWRLVYPIIPLLLIFMVSGINRIARQAAFGNKEKVACIFLCGIFLTTLMTGGLFIFGRNQTLQTDNSGGYRHMTAYYQVISVGDAITKAQTELGIINGLKRVAVLTEPGARVAWFSPMYVHLLSKRRSVSIPIKPDTEKIEALLKRSRTDYVFLSRYHPRQYSDKVNGLIFLDDYARLGEVIWSNARERAGEEVMCVLIRIKPTSNKQKKAAVSRRTIDYIQDQNVLLRYPS